MRIAWQAAALAVLCTAMPVQAAAEPLRDALTQASFGDRDKMTALKRVEAVIADLRDNAGAEAAVLRATALGYRAKLTGSRTDLSSARKQYEAALAVQPRNAEAQLGLGAWHMGVITKAGALLGRVFGANRGKGEEALDRAVALGGDRAFYSGLAGLFRIRQDPADARGRQLCEQAVKAGTPTGLDRILQRSANAVLVQLRAGHKDEARALAQRLLPMGGIPGIN